MPRYRYVGEGRAFIPDARVEVDSGEEFDSEVELNNATLVPVDAAPEAPAPAPAPEAPAEEVSQ